MPDEEKAEWNDSPLNLLEKYVSKANSVQPQNPDHIVSKTRNLNDIPTDWTKMSKEDKNKNWSAIVSSYLKN